MCSNHACHLWPLPKLVYFSILYRFIIIIPCLSQPKRLTQVPAPGHLATAFISFMSLLSSTLPLCVRAHCETPFMIGHRYNCIKMLVLCCFTRMAGEILLKIIRKSRTEGRAKQDSKWERGKEELISFSIGSSHLNWDAHVSNIQIHFFCRNVGLNHVTGDVQESFLGAAGDS